MTWDPPGYSVLLVPIDALERAVRPPLERWAPDYLMSDGATNAHITILAPFLDDPWTARPRLRELLAEVPPFDVTLRSLGRFPDSGLVYVAPEPPDPWRRLTDLVTREWPDHRPYGGRFGSVTPHLSIDHADSVDRIAPIVEHLLPVTTHVDEVAVAWYQPRATRHLYACSLGEPPLTG